MGASLVSLVPIFKVLVTPQAKVLFRESERAKRQQWLEMLAGHECDVVIRRPPQQRTLDQSRYLHAVPFRLIHELTGHTVDDVKRFCLAAKFGTRGIDERGWPVPIIEHTSSLEIGQAADLIDFLPPYAIEEFNGLEIPMPGEVRY